jgi:hypothetical protein
MRGAAKGFRQRRRCGSAIEVELIGDVMTENRDPARPGEENQ